MCGRAYQTYTPEELALRYLDKKPLNLPLFSPNYNLSPTQLSPVIIHEKDYNQLKFFRWGLIPHWAKDKKSAYKMINARSETVAEKPSFRDAIRHRRCLVPLSGFYEWKRDGEAKRPFAIFLKKQPGDKLKDKVPVLSVAGIWEKWVSPSPEISKVGPEEPMEKAEASLASMTYTFAILTVQSNSFMETIHDRMPVILDFEAEREWLDPNLKDPNALKEFLKPCPSEWLETYEISRLVNNPQNNTVEILKPLNVLESGDHRCRPN